MVKKIILGALFLAISGGLIYGGVYRTAARLDTGSKSGGGRQNQFASNSNQRKNHESNFEDQNRSNSSGNQNERNQGNLNKDNLLPFTLAQINFTGTAFEVNTDYLLFRTDDDQDILIENRAWWFALDEGFMVKQGDRLQVAGFYDEEGAFEVSWLSNLTT